MGKNSSGDSQDSHLRACRLSVLSARSSPLGLDGWFTWHLAIVCNLTSSPPTLFFIYVGLPLLRTTWRHLLLLCADFTHTSGCLGRGIFKGTGFGSCWRSASSSCAGQLFDNYKPFPIISPHLMSGFINRRRRPGCREVGCGREVGVKENYCVRQDLRSIWVKFRAGLNWIFCAGAGEKDELREESQNFNSKCQNKVCSGIMRQYNF